MELVGKNIRKKRKDKEYSQEYMATKLGISQNTYSKMEKGDESLTLKRVYKIAELLEVEPVELIVPGSTMVNNSHNQQGGNTGVIVINTQDSQKEFYEKFSVRRIK